MYSNYHNVVDGGGYFQDNLEYYAIWERKIKGLLEIDLVHCTYLIRRDVLELVSYSDSSGRYEYVIFSDNLRTKKIPQYLDNSQEYGVLTLQEDIQAVRDFFG